MMNLKQRVVFSFFAMVAFVAAIALGSCDLAALSIDARISNFVSELNVENVSRTSIYFNFHPDTGDRNAMKTPEIFFNGSALDYETYQPFSFVKTSGPSEIAGGQQQVIGVMSRQNGMLNNPVTFIMQEDNGNWLIREFDLDIYQIKTVGVASSELIHIK